MRCTALVGGMDFTTQKKKLEEAPHFVVGTPGRMAEQFLGSEIAQKYLKNLEFIVMDEVDKLLDESLFTFIRQIIEILPKKPIQRIFCTATVDLEDVSKIKNLSTKEIVQVSTHRGIEKAKSITLRYLLMPDHVKDCYFTQILKDFEGNDIMVFVNSVEYACIIEGKLTSSGGHCSFSASRPRFCTLFSPKKRELRPYGCFGTRRFPFS